MQSEVCRRIYNGCCITNRTPLRLTPGGLAISNNDLKLLWLSMDGQLNVAWVKTERPNRVRTSTGIAAEHLLAKGYISFEG